MGARKNFAVRVSSRGGLNVNAVRNGIAGIVRDNVSKAMIAGAHALLDEIRSSCPVDSGNMKRSAYLMYTGSRRPPMPTWSEHAKKYTITPEHLEKMTRDHVTALTSAKNSVNMGINKRNNFRVQVGISAYYGVYVHEYDNSEGQRNRKFMEKAVWKSAKKAGKIVMDHARTQRGNAPTRAFRQAKGIELDGEM